LGRHTARALTSAVATSLFGELNHREPHLFDPLRAN
jgi:hypothetical protein